MNRLHFVGRPATVLFPAAVFHTPFLTEKPDKLPLVNDLYVWWQRATVDSASIH